MTLGLAPARRASPRAGSLAATLLGSALRGWQEEVNHSADGPDGTLFAYVRDGVICIFEGRWDGGDDSDPSVKPDDEYKGAGHCAAGLPWQD